MGLEWDEFGQAVPNDDVMLAQAERTPIITENARGSGRGGGGATDANMAGNWKRWTVPRGWIIWLLLLLLSAVILFFLWQDISHRWCTNAVVQAYQQSTIEAYG